MESQEQSKSPKRSVSPVEINSEDQEAEYTDLHPESRVRIARNYLKFFFLNIIYFKDGS